MKYGLDWSMIANATEQLVGIKGRCPFKMYLPSKPNKCGMEIVMLCDQCTKYMCNDILYLGKQITPEKIPVAIYFVENLVTDIKGTSSNITTQLVHHYSLS